MRFDRKRSNKLKTLNVLSKINHFECRDIILLALLSSCVFLGRKKKTMTDDCKSNVKFWGKNYKLPKNLLKENGKNPLVKYLRFFLFIKSFKVLINLQSTSIHFQKEAIHLQQPCWKESQTKCLLCLLKTLRRNCNGKVLINICGLRSI